jgi:phosphatidylserine/phosphatidylglycerophosphate/cardiolipin synthase-like enzyme
VTTDVYVFLPPPSASGLHREAHPYGPSAGGFKTELTIEVHPSGLNEAPALAVITGLVRLIPDPTPATTCTLVLTPSPATTGDLFSLLGGVVTFVYRNLDTASARAFFEPRIAALGDEPFLTSEDLTSRVNRFLNGEYSVFVQGGDELASLGGGGADDWGSIGLEVVFVPNALIGAEGWARLQEIIEPNNLQTRRLDPASFYQMVITDSGGVGLAPPHAGHLLLQIFTKRVLLELRNAYDLPFVGTADVSDDSSGTTTSQNFTIDNRGTVELMVVPPGSTSPAGVTYGVTLGARVFTQLPSGSGDTSDPARELTAPAHWALQLINLADWFTLNTFPLSSYTKSNKITHLIDGLSTFREMVASMSTVKSTGHYLRIAGWWLTDSFELIPTPPTDPVHGTTTFARLTQNMAARGAQVRALLWDQWGTQNNDEVSHINSLPGGNGRAILDDETPNVGSHHQKLMVINGSAGAVAFCGGVDLNPDRLDDTGHCAPSPFHDVHTKVEGPAVADINTTFVQRWNGHPSSPTSIPAIPPPFDTSPGSHYAQVTRTFAPSHGYPFAPGGDLGTLRAVRHAIQSAQRFIYVEDQYLTPYPGPYPFDPAQDRVGVLTDLLDALARPSVEYLIMLVPNHTDQPQNRFRRHNFIRPLRDAFPGKVHVFYLIDTCPTRLPVPGSTTAAADKNREDPTSGSTTDPSASSSSGGPQHPREVYVHTKSWIVDDVYVKIGSCNVNRRGFTHDTEIDLHVIDGALENGARAFARSYRVDLWGEHLNLPATAGRNRLLDDPTFALQFWLNPPAGARIRPYDENAEHDQVNTDFTWNTFIDPDGR